MSKRASPEALRAYLAKLKKLLAAGKYDFVPRRKNLQALAEHGLTLGEVKEELLGLVAADYYKGPKEDLDPRRQGEVWEFKKALGGVPFYIKVKVVEENGEEKLKCLGFHQDEYP